ncbi:TetR/AcrR family transcriptional regulator [Rothia koreensis]|uniref:TetR/AcrR family transcriptional regulator n=1 Tax=Rothia koreensis TaxID=592378 RepID=UPI003F24999B
MPLRAGLPGDVAGKVVRVTENATRKRGRPAQTILSSTTIVQAARELLESHGENFTMTMLAKRLGVAVSSLYNHVQSRDEVFARISDDVVRGIDVQDLARLTGTEDATEGDVESSPAEWRSATEVWARSYFRAFAAQPYVVATLALTPVAEAPQTLAMYEAVAEAFLRAGWPEGEVLRVIETLESFLLGTALDAAAPADIFDPGQLSTDYAVMARLHHDREEVSGPAAAERALDLGLPSMLDGLEQRLREHLGIS